MSLPKYEYPTFELTLPSDKKVVKFRPFLVSEQRVLLMGKQGDEKDQVEALRQIMKSCCITPVEVDKLPLFDLEYFFTKLRAKSVGETTTVRFRCTNEVDQKECGSIQDVTVNLDKVEVRFPEKDRRIINLTDNFGIKLRYPKFESMSQLTSLKENDDDLDSATDLIFQCTECIYFNDEVFDRFTPSEFKEFLDSLPVSKLEEILEFFYDLPQIYIDVTFQCKVCGNKETMPINGLDSFFD